MGFSTNHLGYLWLLTPQLLATRGGFSATFTLVGQGRVDLELPIWVCFVL